MDAWLCFFNGVQNFKMRYVSDPDETCGVSDIVNNFAALHAKGYTFLPDDLYIACMDTKIHKIWGDGPAGMPRTVVAFNCLATSMWSLPFGYHLLKLVCSLSCALLHLCCNFCTGCTFPRFRVSFSISVSDICSCIRPFWSVYVSSSKIDEDVFKKVVGFLQTANVDDFQKMKMEVQTAILDQLTLNPQCKLGTHWEKAASRGPDEVELYTRDYMELAMKLRAGRVDFTPESMLLGKIDPYQQDLTSQLKKLPLGNKACFITVGPRVSYVSRPPSLTCPDHLERIHKAVADEHFKGIMQWKHELRRKLKLDCLS